MYTPIKNNINEILRVSLIHFYIGKRMQFFLLKFNIWTKIVYGRLINYLQILMLLLKVYEYFLNVIQKSIFLTFL